MLSFTSRGEGPFMKVAIVGLDIAKHVFQLHGTDRDGKVVLRRKMRRHEVVPFFRQPSKLRRRTGSVWRCALLGAAADCGGSCRAADRPAICEAICEVQQERRQRCGGNLRSRRSPQHAFRFREIGRAAGHPVPSSSAKPVGELPHAARQPTTRAADGVRNRIASARWPGTTRGSRDLGR